MRVSPQCFFMVLNPWCVPETCGYTPVPAYTSPVTGVVLQVTGVVCEVYTLGVTCVIHYARWACRFTLCHRVLTAAEPTVPK